MSTRTYKDAVDCLNSLQSNAATLEASRASGGKLVKVAIPETIEYLQRIGYSVSKNSLLFTYDLILVSSERRSKYIECDPCYWHQGKGIYMCIY